MSKSAVSAKSFDLAEMDLDATVSGVQFGWVLKDWSKLNMWCCKVLFRWTGGLTARIVSIKAMNFSGYYA